MMSLQKIVFFLIFSASSSFAFSAIIQAGSSYKGSFVLPAVQSDKSITWQCDGSKCASNTTDTLTLKSCTGLVKKVGKITYFVSSTERWSPVSNAEKLQRCNKYAQ